MTTQTQTETQTTETTTTTPDLGSLSFSDYERARRGEAVTVQAAKESAPEMKDSHEQKTEASDSETGATEAKESETTEETSGAESEELDTAAKTEEESVKPGKKKGGIQKRFDKLSKEKSELQREAEYWKKVALEKGATETKTDAPKVETKAASTSEDKPKPENFETHAEYVEALTDWKVEQKEKARELKEQKKQAETEQSKILSEHAKRVEAFKASHDDFEDVMENLDDVPRSPAVEQAILNSDNGPEILYELGLNPKEAKRIASLPPIAAAMEIGKIQARIASKASEAKTETNKVTKAPNPVSHIGATKAAVKKTPDEMSFSEYEKWRRESKRKRA